MWFMTWMPGSCSSMRIRTENRPPITPAPIAKIR